MKKLILPLFVIFNFTAFADEPAYCNPETFNQFEIQAGVEGLHRGHLFQIGSLKFLGVAVGHSDLNAIQTLANQNSSFTQEERFCTWYFNDGSAEAAATFHHRYVENPILGGGIPMFSLIGIENQYENVLRSSFVGDATTFVSCAQNHRYLAIGCDGQRHRGPSVFAMILAFSGCTPQHSVDIASQIWGYNYVQRSTRLAIANRGKLLGDQNPAQRLILQNLMIGRN